MMIMVFRLCKAKIETGQYTNKEDMQMMLDIFLAGNRLDFEEYSELVDILEQKEIEKVK